MKKEFNYSLLALLLFVFAGVSSCSSEDEVSLEDKQLKKLIKSWKAISVTQDDNPVLGYQNLELILVRNGSTLTYETSNTPVEYSTWPQSGTWILGDDVVTQMVRDSGTIDELNMTYTVTSTELEIKFQFAGLGYPGGKVSALHGQWVYKFEPK